MERARFASRRWALGPVLAVGAAFGTACAGGEPGPTAVAETTVVPVAPAARPAAAPMPATTIATTAAATTATGAGTAPDRRPVVELGREPVREPITRVAAPVATESTLDIDRLPTLGVGDVGPEVRELQEQLNRVIGAGLVPDGRFGPATVAAVEDFQDHAWIPVTGAADHTTRTVLAALAADATGPTWPAPTVGNGSFPGCQVAVVGDSLMAGTGALHAAALAEIGCAADVDGVGGRSLNTGWQCRVPDGDRTPLMLLPEAPPGNTTCAPSGLELLALWAQGGGLGDLVVVALGTNDAGLYREATWIAHWGESMRLAGGRPVLFLTSQARPGDRRHASQAAYSEALRSWCAATPQCFVGDWAATAIANDAAAYVDGVHLTLDATRARAGFVRDAVASVLAGIDPATIASTVPAPAAPPTTAAPPASSTSTVPGPSTTTPTRPSTTTSSTTTTSSSTSTSTTTTTTTTTTSTSTTTTTTATTTPAG